MFLTQTGRVTVEVSLKVAATKSSVTRQLKKICDTWLGLGFGFGLGLGLGLGLRLGLGPNLLVAQVALVLFVHVVW